MRSLETRFAFERSHLACSCKWALAEVGCSDTSYPASVQPRQKASPCLSYCWWSFLVPATLLCMSCGSHPQPWLPVVWGGRPTAVETAHPFSTVSGAAACSQHSSASSASSGAGAFTCFSRGKKQTNKNVLSPFFICSHSPHGHDCLA